MNVWAAIADKVERETGYQVVSLNDKNDTINVNQIVLTITSVSRSSLKDAFEVAGEFAIKYSHEHGCWEIVTELLALEMTGCRTEAVLTTYTNGFTAMSIGFNTLVWQDKNREFRVESVHYD